MVTVLRGILLVTLGLMVVGRTRFASLNRRTVALQTITIMSILNEYAMELTSEQQYDLSLHQKANESANEEDNASEYTEQSRPSYVEEHHR